MTNVKCEEKLSCDSCGGAISTTDAEFISTCYVVGATTGGSLGFASAWAGAQAGTAIGAALGPVGAVCGGIVGALIAASVGASAGGAIGEALGTRIEEAKPKVKCPVCGAIQFLGGIRHGA